MAGVILSFFVLIGEIWWKKYVEERARKARENMKRYNDNMIVLELRAVFRSDCQHEVRFTA